MRSWGVALADTKVRKFHRLRNMGIQTWTFGRDIHIRLREESSMLPDCLCRLLCLGGGGGILYRQRIDRAEWKTISTMKPVIKFFPPAHHFDFSRHSDSQYSAFSLGLNGSLIIFVFTKHFFTDSPSDTNDTGSETAFFFIGKDWEGRRGRS